MAQLPRPPIPENNLERVEEARQLVLMAMDRLSRIADGDSGKDLIDSAEDQFAELENQAVHLQILANLIADGEEGYV